MKIHTLKYLTARPICAFMLMLAFLHSRSWGASADQHTVRGSEQADSSDVAMVFTSKAEFHGDRLALSITGLTLSNYLAYQPFKDVWWNEEKTSFHFYNGWRRNKGYYDFGWYDSYCGHLDKLGHIYGSRLLADLLTDVSQWIGFSKKESLLLGSVASFLLMLEIEIYDSFFEEWGFSIADLTANSIGSFSPLLVADNTFLSRFSLKMSYHPSKKFSSEKYYLKDYGGMTYWLSYQIIDDTRDDTGYWPDFLNFSIGYGVTRTEHGEMEFYLAPDIDLTRLITTHNRYLAFVLKLTRYIHVPCVTLKLYPTRTLYFIYF